ncbi:uncharacterized protein HaLaN_05170 [Haematococcus lacustris]|uniref:IFT52 central domain-containing protein n=1 Tax=Haematococcus lacustris TaxID=44745 RepID=A0A699YQ86_HAELA|nr:uncharacterized protein HaLaN_05170 [Haematococcus lacustris]
MRYNWLQAGLAPIDLKFLPDTASLASKFKGCLQVPRPGPKQLSEPGQVMRQVMRPQTALAWLRGQVVEGEEIPRDWMSLFDDSLFKLDTRLIPDAVALYDKLN